MLFALFATTAATLGRGAAALVQAPGNMMHVTTDTVRGDDAEGQKQARLITKRQVLKNVDNVIYTATILVGQQELDVIIDSGSFDLVVFSTDCVVCNQTHLYDTRKSLTYTKGNMMTTCTYGSGVAFAHEAYDNILVGDVQGSQQLFWKSYDVDMQLLPLMSSSFQGICGLGPSKSAVAFAEYELSTFIRELEQYTELGGIAEPSITESVNTMQDKIELTKSQKTMMDTLNILDISVCFGKESLSSGFVTWNDLSSQIRPDLFVEVPVVGDFYWAAELTDVRVGAVQRGLVDQTNFPKSLEIAHSLGCDGRHCSALMDTGTSILYAPSSVASVVDKILAKWELNGGDCEDLSLLPDLEFSLAGKAFRLPPESYVAHYTGSDASFNQVQHLLPRLYSKHLTRRSGDHLAESYTYCASILSPFDATTQFGPVWVMGMPFFREYYTTFHESNGRASSMSFAKASADCEPTDPSVTQLQRTSMSLTEKRNAQLRLDVSKIRTSGIVERSQAATTSKLPALVELSRERFGSSRPSPIIHI